MGDSLGGRRGTLHLVLSSSPSQDLTQRVFHGAAKHVPLYDLVKMLRRDHRYMVIGCPELWLLAQGTRQQPFRVGDIIIVDPVPCT